MNLHVLIMDDDVRITMELQEYLVRHEFAVDIANDAETGLQMIKNQKPDIVFLDIRLGESNGLEILKGLKEQYPDLEVIMITGHADMDTVIEALRLGAFDFLKKPFRQIEAKIAISRTGKYVKMQQKLQKYEVQNSLISFELGNKLEREFIGESRQMREVMDDAVNAAQYDVNVLITGESGTGKEIISRVIHYSSRRKDGIFFPINCSAVPKPLMESIFFGHKKGSFTGADEDRKGVFELANRGTLFLDEIADMPVEMQSKLLRVIEEKKFRRLGTEQDVDSDVRIVAATNHNLSEEIQKGGFRLDLYHRLNTVVIHIPPLRERREDINPLIKHFLNQFCRKNGRIIPQISAEALQALHSYDFPGNVRELKNLIERALILAKGTILTVDNFPICRLDHSQQPCIPKSYNLEDNEKMLIKAALAKTRGNQTQAAELLGISRHTLIRRLEKWKRKI